MCKKNMASSLFTNEDHEQNGEPCSPETSSGDTHPWYSFHHSLSENFAPKAKPRMT